ncbi:ferric reductase NAD binding domain-containing protein [Cristinia sonorae]|uniref:ferric-chelate reductase (NADPH) n=1 Tax=Cristinia sonorae TaxID=1940300 RepID=A0A8K0XTR5_9AGAR|nr:ferric reductase NAD binding domain-containing protein [Cristinia sonorae]
MVWTRNPLSLVHRATPTAADRKVKALQQVRYTQDLWITIGAVMALLTAIRLIRLALRFMYPPSPPPMPTFSEKLPQEEVQPGHSGRISWRRLPYAVLSAFRIVAFRLQITIGPGISASVSELTFIFGYISVIFVLLFMNTHDLNAFWYEDRAAHYASSQLPLIVALAGKNNIISFFTGISHEKLNILHRAAARTCLILLWVHAIARVVTGLPQKFDFTHFWMQCGAVGLTAITLAAILSVRPIRTAFFELFLVGHIFLIAIFLLFGYLHARDPDYGDYIWPALVLWAFDRLLRLGTLVLNNRLGRTRHPHEGTATVELLSQDTIRLTLRRRMNWKAGQHAYVVLPTISDLPSEAHPFTISTISKSLDGTDGSEEKDVTFLIRGRSGFTARLKEHASGQGNSTVPAFIDGPYGCPPDLTTNHTCILIAGGSGVSYILPLLLDLVHNARAGRSSVRRIVFVWAVREPEHLKWISKILNEAMAQAQSTQLSIDPRIYITGPKFSPSLTELSMNDRRSEGGDSVPVSPVTEASDEKTMGPLSEKTSDQKLGLSPWMAINLIHGRPSISKILQEEISVSSGPVSVDVAGPSALSRAVSNALATKITSPISVLRGAPSVSLHVEVFGM